MPSCRQSSFRVLYTLAAAALLLLVLSLAIFVRPAEGAAPQAPPGQAGGQGEQLFKAKCSGCHSIGAGKLVGPDLAGVAQRRDPAWIKNFVNDPAKMLGSDPTAKQLLQQYNGLKMPTVGLSPTELDAVVGYISNPGGAPAAGAAPVGAAGGIPANGALVFTGQAPLLGRGPACMGCHTVQGTGNLGGGSLGPDLTHVATRLGQPGLTAALQTIAFPTMLGPFTNKPLAPAEQADLVAFLVQADQQQPPVLNFAPGAITVLMWLILAVGVAGVAALFVLLALFWPRQRQSIAAELRANARLRENSRQQRR